MARLTLDALTTLLRQAAGENLVCFLLFGSAARGDYDKMTSDVNTVLILEDASVGALRPLAEPVKRWVKGGQSAPLVFSAAGWRGSADVFPIELEDMRQSHRVLAGEDPFEGLETTPADLRSELEGEARGKLIQLRTEFVATEADGKALSALLERSAKTFFVLFRAAVRLGGEAPPENHRALLERAAEVAGMDITAFDWVLGRLAREKLPALSAYDPRGEEYLRAIETFVRYVDQHAI